MDTNVLRATINRKNEEFFLYELFADKKIEWVISTEILLEYAEKLTDFYSESTANFILKILCTANNVIFSEPHFRWNIIQNDVEDNKFSDLAISTNADCLITYDKDFNIFKSLDFPHLSVMTPQEFKSEFFSYLIT